MAIHLDNKHVAKTFSAILRRDVGVSVLKPVAESELVIAGHYVNGKKELIGACFVNKAFAVYSGAAFSLIPSDVAKDALKTDPLDEIVQENFAEVLNICSRLFDGGSELRVALSGTEFPPAPRSDVSKGLLGKPAKRIDLELDIAGYGKGRMAVVLAAAA